MNCRNRNFLETFMRNFICFAVMVPEIYKFEAVAQRCMERTSNITYKHIL